jgi:hypothetical protein
LNLPCFIGAVESQVASPIKCRRIEFPADDDEEVYHVCAVTGRRYYLSAFKSNGIRIGCGEMVSVSVSSDEKDEPPSLSYCQVAAIWKTSNEKSNDFIVAGRWFEPLFSLKKYFTKTKNL